MLFEERISVGRLNEIVWDKSIVDEVIAKTDLISRYIEGHLHSDAYSAQKPSTDILLKEIEDYEALKKNLIKLKKP